MKRPKETAKRLRSLNAKRATKSGRIVKGGATIMKTTHDTIKSTINNTK